MADDMTQQLHQISVSYSSEEDRLLLIIKTHNQEEYRIWLTRRYTQMLLSILRKIMHEFGGLSDQAVSDQVQTLVKGGAFKRPLDPVTDTLPFGEDGILAYGLKTQQISPEQYAINIFSKDQHKIHFNLDRTNIVMLDDLLQQSLVKTDWNFPELRPRGEAIH